MADEWEEIVQHTGALAGKLGSIEEMRPLAAELNESFGYTLVTLVERGRQDPHGYPLVYDSVIVGLN